LRYNLVGMQNIQKQIWEHQNREYKNYGSSRTFDPSKQLPELGDYFRGNNISTQGWVVLDLACGNGKNSIYALNEWKCNKAIGIDFDKAVLDEFRMNAREKGIEDKINLIDQSIGSDFPLENNSIDLIFDIFSSINLEEEERINCRDESLRVLKSGGFMFTYLTAVESGFIKEMMDVDLGPEPGSVVFGNGKFEQTYSEEEIKNFYKDFEMHILKKNNFMIGKFPVEMHWVLLRKRR
jgi:ubiquinone/menaquinone biosynthesis C-methylase UbiE